MSNLIPVTHSLWAFIFWIILFVFKSIWYIFLSFPPKYIVLLSGDNEQQYNDLFVNFGIKVFLFLFISNIIPLQSFDEVIIKFESFDMSKSVIVDLCPFKIIFH